MTLKSLAPIRTDNEVLLLKAAKDVIEAEDTDLITVLAEALHRLRRAVAIVEGDSHE